MIYVDMDGVVADFDASITALFGEKGLDEQKNADAFWKETCVKHEVFRQMPEIPEGMLMVEWMIKARYPICFCTSTGGMPHHIDVARQKLMWLHDHGLGAYPVAFAMNTAGKRPMRRKTAC